MAPLACIPSLVMCWRRWCAQVGSDGKTDPQELKDTSSRLPSKTLPDQQPPGQLVRDALLRETCCHFDLSPAVSCVEQLVWRADQQASRCGCGVWEADAVPSLLQTNVDAVNAAKSNGE